MPKSPNPSLPKYSEGVEFAHAYIPQYDMAKNVAVENVTLVGQPRAVPATCDDPPSSRVQVAAFTVPERKNQQHEQRRTRMSLFIDEDGDPVTFQSEWQAVHDRA